MRTEADLQRLYALLEREADAYLDESVSGSSGTRTIAADLVAVPAAVPGAGGWSRRRSRIAPLLAAAAVAVSALIAFALHERGADTAAAGNATMCKTALPPAWRAALHGRQVSVPGRWVTADAITPRGVVIVDWLAADGSVHIGSEAAGAPVKDLARLAIPANHLVVHLAATATAAVIVLAPDLPKDNPSAPVDQIRLVNLSSGRSEDILAKAPTPAGYVVRDGKWAAVQDGVFYWLAGPDHENAPQTLMSYDIARRSYTVRATRDAGVYWNPLGISWSDGAVPVHGLPPVLPPAGEHRLTVAFDGNATAWSLYDDPATVYWSDRSGESRAVTQHLMSQLTVQAVVGPYVLLTYGEGDDSDQVNGDVQVLDTRTGALADTGLARYDADGTSRDGIVAFSDRDGGRLPLIVLDTNGLPELTCR